MLTVKTAGLAMAQDSSQHFFGQSSLPVSSSTAPKVEGVLTSGSSVRRWNEEKGTYEYVDA